MKLDRDQIPKLAEDNGKRGGFMILRTIDTDPMTDEVDLVIDDLGGWKNPPNSLVGYCQITGPCGCGRTPFVRERHQTDLET